jgi:hypothetical protein
VQDDDLFTEHPPDDEQRLHQYRQVGDILDKLLDAGLEPPIGTLKNRLSRDFWRDSIFDFYNKIDP